VPTITAFVAAFDASGELHGIVEILLGWREQDY